jgi:hypothetical protein
LLDLVDPAWEGLLEEELVGEVVATSEVEGGEESWSPDEAGSEMVFEASDFFGEAEFQLVL